MSHEISFCPDHERAARYFARHPDYQPTPLFNLNLASGDRLLVKNETARLGLTSFKALGAPYAIAQILLSDWNAQADEPIDHLQSAPSAFRAFSENYTFVAASAGNHGMGLAWGAAAVGARSIIYLSDQVSLEFEASLRRWGAEIVRSGATYEESVSAATKHADQSGAHHVADSSWPGYYGPPALVMEGYTVIAEELRDHFTQVGGWPTHVYLQCGVGGLAAAIAHMIRKNWLVQPQLIIVEPEAAACMQASHCAARLIEVGGPPSSMGRLDCKVPSLLAWQTLERCNVGYVTISDEEGQEAAEDLSALGVFTTSSGAAGLAGMKAHRSTLEATTAFSPLVIVTEAKEAGNATAE